MMKTKNYLLLVFCLCSISLFAQDYCDFKWRYTNFGDNAGLRSTRAADVNGDGIPEIFVNTYDALGWYILNYNADNGQYEKVWTSPPNLETFISQINLIDWDEDGDLEIFVSNSYGDTRIYDGQTMAEIGFFDLPTSFITNLLFADADNDGEKELIASSEYDGFIVNKDNLSIEYTFGIPTRDMVVGQVDADPDLEIITADGDVYQLNGTSLKLEWNAIDIDAFNNIRHIELLQIDEDEALEIIIAYNWNLHILDAEEQQIKYEGNSTDGRINEMVVRHPENSDTSEIYIGHAGGSIVQYSLDLATQTEIAASTNNVLSTIKGFAFADTDNNGKLDVVVANEIIAEEIQVIDFETGALAWRSFDIDGPFAALEYIPSTNKIISFAYGGDGRSDEGVLAEIDPATGKEINLDLDVFRFYNIHGIDVVQLSDNTPEQILAYGLYNVFLLDPVTYETNKFNSEGFGNIYSAKTVDLDNDGIKEILVGDNGGIHILDADLKKIDGIDIFLGNTTAIYAVNIDQDAGLEIVFAHENIQVYDDDLTILWRSGEGRVNDIGVTDWNNNGTLDVISSNEYGDLVFYDLTNFQEFQRIKIGFEDLNGVHLTDLNNDGLEELLTASEGIIYLIDENNEGVPLIQDVNINNYIQDFMIFEDLDADGNKELIYANNYSVNAISGNCYQSFLTTSTDEILLENNKLAAYPNPVTDILTIQQKDLTDFQLQLYTMSGQELMSLENSFELDLGNIPEGVYLLKVIEHTTGKGYTQKVIKL